MRDVIYTKPKGQSRSRSKRRTFLKKQYGKDWKRHDHGSVQGLLWTSIPNERKTLLEKWLASDLRGLLADLR